MFSYKKAIVAVVLASCLFGVWSFVARDGEFGQMWERSKVDGVWIYSTDYVSEYQDTLNAMFGDRWSVVHEEDVYHEPEEICDHVDSSPMWYKEWTIQYFDANDEPQEFVLSNTNSISSQVERYLESYVAPYYETHFYNQYLVGVPLEGSSYVFGFVERIAVNPHTDENRPRVENVDVYKEGWNTPEGAVCLSRLSPANVFVKCPFYLSIHVSINDEGLSVEEKKAFELDVKSRILAMIEDMNKFTNGTLNANVDMVIDRAGAMLHDGKARWSWNFVEGQDISEKLLEYGGYEVEVYNSYIGDFWE